jgi:hypothetical protein
MNKLRICDKSNKCSFCTCRHMKPHEKERSCEAYYCHIMHDDAHCELINQGFNPEEIIAISFGGTNE